MWIFRGWKSRKMIFIKIFWLPVKVWTKNLQFTRGNLVVKSKLSPRSDSIALRQLDPIHKKVP